MVGAAAQDYLEVVTVFPEEPPDTSCRPIRVRCSDDATWYLKGSHLGRVPVTEQVVARMALLIGAPVPQVAIVRLGAAEAETLPEEVRPGLYHGSREIPNADVVYWLRSNKTNQSDIAGIDVLFSWAHSGDEQYLLDADDRYFSFDHGAFLPGGPCWDKDSLQTAEAPGRLDMFGRAGVGVEYYRPILERLEALTVEEVAAAVGMHPAEWECTVDDRVALAEYFWSRRGPTLGLFRGQP
ncbi:hypothetical protein FDZ71_00210 [bacterium]|nr:MAG: hypothetical protein FDZ71_00210 [bacterium]